jgi:hypothetical protein
MVSKACGCLEIRVDFDVRPTRGTISNECGDVGLYMVVVLENQHQSIFTAKTL